MQKSFCSNPQSKQEHRMRTKQAITKKLNVSTEKAWQAIRDRGGPAQLDRYLVFLSDISAG